ncbi:MAG: YetF domain-containing protein [Pseudomonadota bacterium]
MFDMQLPWWEFVLRGAVVYLVLLLMVRISGRRTIGQFTPFDLLVVMLLSEAVSNSLSGGDDSLTGGLLIAATLIALNVGISYISSRSSKMSDLLDGDAVLIGRNGKFFDKAIKRLRLSQPDLDEALRQADCELSEMRCAFLEADGAITVQKK